MKNSTRMSESATMSTKEARMGPFVLQAPVSARASATMSSQRKGKRFSRCLRKSLKKSAAESTMPQQSSTDVATRPSGIEQVDENEEDAQEMMALMVWLMRLYSSRSGERPWCGG